MEAAAQQRAAREEVPAVVPRPVGTTTSGAVQYLTSEQKEALNRKYGRIRPPTNDEMEAVADAGAACKMQ
ncbi:hypothetical protein EMIHUDRAFT_311496 [Emiliania huxleyi CCMP1516]|uniref:Uncharacterized protein n=2 Tax=Emiliania huxleyi TaxID=2903 RepID=A0A0D3IKM6_EMIH1|nr:hypothetical protein EMIHUDRAFT_311496 [Emiliania huxleyi CCMP1516]EOD11811.1 hypothetical protein EMIHUDRAFT_311496 [Emiliania huxleyi CCMP1516]|eukprot:XP_005764240.1 hypothetical protein EMIHUDRAFT_311496 [Emiliania huxleyi CCMP1516]